MYTKYCGINITVDFIVKKNFQHHSYIIHDGQSDLTTPLWQLLPPGESVLGTSEILQLSPLGATGGDGVTTQRIISCTCHGAFAFITVADCRK